MSEAYFLLYNVWQLTENMQRNLDVHTTNKTICNINEYLIYIAKMTNDEIEQYFLSLQHKMVIILGLSFLIKIFNQYLCKYLCKQFTCKRSECWHDRKYNWTAQLQFSYN